jgi:hypothetical protein
MFGFYLQKLYICKRIIEKLKKTIIMDFGKVLLKLLGFAKDYVETSQKSEQPARQAQPVQRNVAPAVQREKTAAEWEAYFKEILLSEFSSYSIREKVKVTDLVGFVSDEAQLYTTRPRQVYKAEWGQPYTFVLESGGSPKAVVMLGNGHSHDENVKYLVARMYAKKLDIPYINFYTQMDNERGYVIERIRKFLN